MYLTNNVLLNPNRSWVQINAVKNNTKLLNVSKKNLVIYSYSISNNILKEILLKVDIEFSFTNNFQKASLIIGLTKHLQQNLKLIQFAKEKKIPIYAFQQIRPAT